MANYRAIGATCEAILRVLEQAASPDMFGGATLQFKVFGPQDFSQALETGVSLFLYRVEYNANQRPAIPRTGPDGKPLRSPLPLDLHFLLTPWAGEPSLAHEILGWLLRTLDDTAILPSGILNSPISNVFEASETIEVVPGQLTNEEMFRIWDVLPTKYQLSVPYVARVVRIDSLQALPGVSPVITRQIDYEIGEPA